MTPMSKQLWKALHSFAQENQSLDQFKQVCQEISDVIAQGANVNECNEQGVSPLRFVLEHCPKNVFPHVKNLSLVIKSMLDARVDLFSLDHPLAVHGNYLVSHLFSVLFGEERQFDIFLDKDGNNIAHEVSKVSSQNFKDYLSMSYGDRESQDLKKLLNEKNKAGQTPLMTLWKKWEHINGNMITDKEIKQITLDLDSTFNISKIYSLNLKDSDPQRVSISMLIGKTIFFVPDDLKRPALQNKDFLACYEEYCALLRQQEIEKSTPLVAHQRSHRF